MVNTQDKSMNNTMEPKQLWQLFFKTKNGKPLFDEKHGTAMVQDLLKANKNKKKV